MQTHVFVAQENGEPEIPPECDVLGDAIVDGRAGVVIRPRHGWRVVPGVCCDEWAFVRQGEGWTCSNCKTVWRQVHPGSWRQEASEDEAPDDAD